MLSVQDVQGFIMQLLQALAYIHQRKIAHLDIKVIYTMLKKTCPFFKAYYYKV